MYWICFYLRSIDVDLGSGVGVGVGAMQCNDMEIFEKIGHRCGRIHLLIN